MARYTGPKTKLLVNLARQYSEMIKLSKEVTHLDNTGWLKRGKKSEYAVQLMEKQKAKYSYGI
jgi:small subunit ribosomal protein S4